jgi:hypothetical protein
MRFDLNPTDFCFFDRPRKTKVLAEVKRRKTTTRHLEVINLLQQCFLSFIVV